MKMNRCSGRRCLYVYGIVSFVVFLQVQAKPADKTVLIEGVPHLLQKPDFCGETCIAMYLKKLSYKVTQDDVFNLSGVEPMLARGCVTKDMERVLKRVGFKPGIVWYKIDPRKSKDQLEAQWSILLANLRDGIPSIVCMHYDDRPKSTEHFRLVLGYDPKTNEVIYHEPAEKNGAYRRMKHSKFLGLWPLKYKKDQWLAIHMSLRAGKLSLPKSSIGFTN
ncbi:MAG: C39 family peptidase, partial [Planctomycetota bacterium]